jgi:excisionase family DNA binding protein
MDCVLGLFLSIFDNAYTLFRMGKHDPITTREAAELLDCSQGHVRLLIARGRIAAKTFGRVHLVDRASVMRYLEHERQPGRGRPRKTKISRRKKR